MVLAELGISELGELILGGVVVAPPPPPLLEQDARYRTKVYLDAKLNNENLVKDDGITQVSFAVIYAYPPYPLIKEFLITGDPVDLLFLIDVPTSIPSPSHARYNEAVPIIVSCIDKVGITGTLLKWTAENELRRIFEMYPFGSFRSLDHIGGEDQRIGPDILYQTRLILNYRRTATYVV